MTPPQQEPRIVHIYGTPYAPNWRRSEMLTILADHDRIASMDSDLISPLGRPEEPKQYLPYACGLRDIENRRTIFTFANDTANVHIDTITFGGRKVDIQLLMLTWFDYFQYESVRKEAAAAAEQARESDIACGVIVDVTLPKTYIQVTHIRLHGGRVAGSGSVYFDMPEGKDYLFKQPMPDDIPIFLEMLGLECAWVVIDRAQPRETIQAAIDDLIAHCADG